MPTDDVIFHKKIVTENKSHVTRIQNARKPNANISFANSY